MKKNIKIILFVCLFFFIAGFFIVSVTMPIMQEAGASLSQGANELQAGLIGPFESLFRKK